MSGEKITPESELTKIEVRLHTALGALTGEATSGAEWPEELQGKYRDLALLALAAAIGGYFTATKRPEEFSKALDQEQEHLAGQELVRAELLREFGIGSDLEATEIILEHWQGERPKGIECIVQGMYGTEEEISLRGEAMRLAELATQEDPDARERVNNAQALLWRNMIH